MLGAATSLGGGIAAPGNWLGGSGWPGWKNVPSALRMPFGLADWIRKEGLTVGAKGVRWQQMSWEPSMMVAESVHLGNVG